MHPQSRSQDVILAQQLCSDVIALSTQFDHANSPEQTDVVNRLRRIKMNATDLLRNAILRESGINPTHPALDVSLATVGFSNRIRKAVARLRMYTIGDLCTKTPDELLETRNFGVRSLTEVRDKLEEMGLHLRDDAPQNPRTDYNAGMGDT